MTPATKPSQGAPAGRPHLTTEQKKLVDEYQQVRERCMAWKPNVNPDAARYQELQAAMLELCAAEAPDQAVVLEGNLYDLPISMRENRREIKDRHMLWRRIKRLLGGTDKKMAGVYKITLGQIDKILPSDEHEKFLIQERTGPREIQEPVKRQAA